MSISKLVNALKAWFTPPDKKEFEDVAFSQLQHIDAEEMASRLQLREHGQRLGAAGVPPADASELTGPESSAINEIEKARRGYQAWALRRLTSINHSIAGYDIRHQINSALETEKSFKHKVSEYLTAGDHELRDLRRKLEEENKQLIQFKIENKLTREAEYPSGTKKFALYAFLLFLILIEGAINGQIFQRGLAGGILEGITFAVMFAFFNVASTFMCGSRGFRYVNHTIPIKRILGWSTFLIALGIASLIGLMLGHFRVALNSQADQAMELAWITFKANPLNIGGMDSVLLFGVTMLFGLIAFIDGYKMDDKYPGFGAQQRRYDKALKDYNLEISDLQTHMSDFKSQAVHDLNLTITQSQAALSNLSAQIINKQAAGERVRVALDTAQAAANAVVRIFRDENLVTRENRPYPKYFNSTPSLTPLELPDFDTSNDKAIEDEMGYLLQKLIDGAQDIRASIETAFNAEYNQLKPIAGQFLEEANVTR